ncbi:MAG: alpha/beta hydrolase-fold protein [Bacteroidales bacterium]
MKNRPFPSSPGVSRRQFFKRMGATSAAVSLFPTALMQGQPLQGAAFPASFQEAPAVVSPEILADGRVTFRLLAPEAGTVRLGGDFFLGRDLPMTRDAQGIWSVTTGPVESGFYDYHYVVNGIRTLDPLNVYTTRDGSRYSSSLRVPGAIGDDYQVNDVPHGTVHQVWFPSPSLELEGRRMFVYTPAGYETGTDRYPVFYLLHGGGGDEDAWTNMGRAPQILDNLIAKGKAKPMIVVMTNGNFNQKAAQDMLPLPPNTRGPQGPSTEFRRHILEFPESLLKDVIPFVDKAYRTRADREHRAISGLSMGGAQTLYAAFNHLDAFAWVGEFSAGLPLLPGVAVPIPRPANADVLRGPDITNTIDPDKFLALMPQMNASANDKLKLLYVSIGLMDGLITAHGVFKDILKKQGLKYELFEAPEWGHEWGFWRLTLRDFVPRLFR